jgi:alpha-1,4-galacturonosyltransferase
MFTYSEQHIICLPISGSDDFSKGICHPCKEHDNLSLAWELSLQIRNCQRLFSKGAVSGRAITKDETHPIIIRLALLIYKARDSHYDITTIVTLKNHALALEPS